MENLFLDINKLKTINQVNSPNADEISNYWGTTKYEDKGEKKKAVSNVYKCLNDIVKYNGAYYLHGMNFQDALNVEIFAKALFYLFFERGRKVGKEPNSDELDLEKLKNFPLYIAVDFEKNRYYAMEFIRIFAIFYDKANENKYMAGVQVAVCSTNKETNLKEVNFVLAGKSLDSAYATAKNFVYYNADASLEFIPLLKYLKRSSDDKTEPEPLYPFNLFLQEDNKSWFETQMQRRLNTDLRKSEYGCKISDIKVRLGSKIHIDTFYEAELLLHNVGTIKRFAYLLALNIVSTFNEKIMTLVSAKEMTGKARDGEKDNKEVDSGDKQEDEKGYLFLLGYENYSAVLMQEVQGLLKDYYKTGIKIEWIIDTHSEDFPVLSFDKFSEEEKKDIAAKAPKDKIYCITILPLGSTMSTVYKLHDSFLRGLERIGSNNINKNRLFLSNYCLLAIGRVFFESKAGNKDNIGIANNYIDEVGYDKWHIATLKQKVQGQEGIKVKYLLSASSTWSNPYEASSFEKPLLKVDKTSTLLDTQFQTPLKKNIIGYYNGEKRESKVDELKPDNGKSYIKYGHILRGDNHYQFYFDFEKLTESKASEIERWAEKLKDNIDSEAYNIVISPLQITNASFLKIILDKAFGSNLHLLHINILGTGKENIRTKFEYIAKEFTEIIKNEQKINFYYVDDAVCTGSGLARAWKFLLSLCNQSNKNLQDLFPDGEKFTKVFLLINRSSYETANTWVKNPNEDWLGFINLCVPSYNTHMEHNVATCPGCRVHFRYEQLRKRSTTNEIVSYFDKHEKKHLSRNPLEYDLWLEDQIYNSPTYFEWLREWVWFHCTYNELLYKTIKDFGESFRNGEESDSERWNDQTIKKFFDWIKALSDSSKINNYKETDKDFNKKNFKISTLNTIRQIIVQDNFLRLKTMDNAYRELLYDDNLQKVYDECRKYSEPDFTQYRKALRGKIVKLLADCFNKTNQYDTVFEFISYIKVISRDYLAKNYFIREAMYDVLKYLYNIMTKKQSELSSLSCPEWLDENKKGTLLSKLRNKDVKKIVLEATLQYRIFKVITHRLALMRDEEMFQAETIMKTIEACEAMFDGEKPKREAEEKICKQIFLTLPKQEEIITSYLASVKTATMEENNDAVCLMLWQQTDKLNKQVNKTEEAH